jgi:hypothetical protein
MPLALVGVVLATPLSVHLIEQPLLPDLFFAALFAWLCVALPGRRAFALLLLVALAFTRETALFLAAALALAAIDRRRFGTAATLLVVTAATWLVVATEFASRGPGNVHALAGPLYLASKFVFNLVRNVFGLELWVDTLSYCEPQVTWRLPEFLPTGAVKSIGWCGFEIRRPLSMLAGWLTIFGILPAVALGRLGLPFRRRVDSDEPWELAGIRLGGWAFFAAAPTLGSTLGRLIAMGWPAFWISTPALLARTGGPVPARRTLVTALGVHGVVAWLPLVADAIVANRTAALSIVVVLSLPAHVWAWREARALRRAVEGEAGRERVTPAAGPGSTPPPGPSA